MIYTNSQGNKINLNADPYWLDCEAIRNYEWEYATKDKKRGHIIAGFTKDVKELDLELDIWGLTEEQKNKNIDDFNNLIEIDIYNGVAGTLSDGDWFTYGYFIASENTDWNKGAPMVRKKVTFVREKLSWYHITRAANFGADSDEQLFVFDEEDIKTFEQFEGTGRKNLLPYPYYKGTETVNGITFTDNGDGTITANGTATATAQHWLRSRTLESFVLPSGDYIITDGIGGSASTTRTAINSTVNGQNVALGSSYQNNGSFTVSSDVTSLGVYIQIQNGQTVNNLVFKPTIRLASDSNPTHEPYMDSTCMGYDYAYNYMTDVQSQKTITNPGSVPCDFIVNIQGYVDRPILKIGDNILSVDVEIPYGAYLTIDSTKKIVVMTLVDGTEINCFGARDPDYYLFERIPYGRNVVTWNGSFIWELKLIEERSEPRWHTV